MQPQNQQQDPTKKASESAASLSFATHLMSQMMQHQSPKAPESSQNAPEQEMEQSPQDDTITKLIEEVDALKQEIKDTSANKEIQDIKSQLEALLQEEESEKQNETPK